MIKMKNSLSILLFSFCFLSCRRIDKEKFVLPLHYEGPVIVIFDQKDGNKEQYDKDGYRVYEIQRNGVCKTQFEVQGGEIIQKFAYKNMDGSLQDLKDIRYNSAEDIYQFPEDPAVLPPNQIYTANWGSTLSGDIYYHSFILGNSKNKINILYNNFFSMRKNAEGNTIGLKIGELFESSIKK